MVLGGVNDFIAAFGGVNEFCNSLDGDVLLIFLDIIYSPFFIFIIKAIKIIIRDIPKKMETQRFKIRHAVYRGFKTKGNYKGFVLGSTPSN